MRRNSLRKFMAWLTLLATLFVAGNGSCFAGDLQTFHASPSDNAGSVIMTAGCAQEVPCCPDDSGLDAAHCGACSACPCHAPLSTSRPLVAYVPSSAIVSFLEYPNAPSDAFRSIFVPPQNLA